MPLESSNDQLLLYCLWRLDGGSRQVEREELFEECWRVAPSRFGWRTRPYPSDKAADQTLRDLARGRHLPAGLVLLSPDRSSARPVEPRASVTDTPTASRVDRRVCHPRACRLFETAHCSWVGDRG